jgi:hypothetical protein
MGVSNIYLKAKVVVFHKEEGFSTSKFTVKVIPLPD